MSGAVTGTSLVLGVDATESSSDPAVDWAAAEAAARRAELRVVHAVPPLPKGYRVPTEELYRRQLADGQEVLDRAVARIRERSPQLDVDAQVVEGVPAPVLVEESRRAGLVVVGVRRLSRLEEWLSTYSVAVPVAAQASCPVVLVPPRAEQREPARTVVVGVDGSATSGAAVGVALELARVHGAAVTAVTAWHRAWPLQVDEESITRRAQEVVAEAAAALPEAGRPEVDLHVVQGHQVDVLARAAEDALALVVGRKGSGGYTGMQLGSVAHGLLRTVGCPLVVVPPPSRD